MSVSTDKLMIDKQAEIISGLRNELRDKFEQVTDLERELNIKRACYDNAVKIADECSILKGQLAIYTALLDQIANNPMLQLEWDRFLTMLKLGADEEYLVAAGAYKGADPDA